MFVIAILFLQLVLMPNVVPGKIDETEYLVVSTTHRPEDSIKTTHAIEELQESTKQILDKVTELEKANSQLESIVRVQNILLEAREKLLHTYTFSNSELLEKVSKLEKNNLFLENVTRMQSAQLESYAKLLQNHTEQLLRIDGKFAELEKANLLLENSTRIQIEKLQIAENTTQLQLPELDKQSLNNTATKLENNIILENVIQIQNQTKLTENQTEKIKIPTSDLLPSDCKEVLEKGNNVSGVYRIKPKLASQSFEVWCDLQTENGGWIYVINRFDGSQNFDLKWADYKNGFGNISGEHWLGLERLYQLTQVQPYELLIEATDWDDKTRSGTYKQFSIGSEKEGYNIKTLNGHKGPLGTDFGYHSGSKFSTRDKNQNTASTNCASEFAAGWWYKNCSYACLLTGVYNNLGQSTNYKVYRGIHWSTFHGLHYSLKKAKMMIRPLD